MKGEPPCVRWRHDSGSPPQASLGVRLAKIDSARMGELLTEAWRSIAPKRAIAALTGPSM
jgi:hypothetical protein